MALPTSLAYMQKPSAIASRAIRSSIAPTNGSDFRGHEAQTIRLEIPTGIQGQYLNPAQSYLKFKVKVSHSQAGAMVCCDKSIYQIFDRLVISHNGIVLEQIDNYGCLANSLLDFQVNASQLENDLSIMLGTTGSAAQEQGVDGIRMIKDTEVSFSMPLLSSFFTMQDKYIPLGDIQNELRVELTLSPNGFKVIADPGGDVFANEVAYTYIVNNIEFMLDIVELDPAVSSAIRKETLSRDGAFKIPLVQWRNYSTTINQGNGSASLTVPAKMNSLKNLLVIQRDQSATQSKNKSKNDRVGAAGKFKSYWFQIGSQMVPAKPVTDPYEAYAELQRSMHDLSIGSGDSVITRKNFIDKKFMIGLELESLSHRSDVLNSGLNTMSTNIYFNPVYDGTLDKTVRCDFFAHYDAMLMIDPTGQCNVVF